MAASMETLGIGGHEYFAEKIFEKVKGLPKDLELVELTKNEYDALTPEQKADPTKLYLVPGDGKYLKFQEISAADYEALSQEEKMDPYTVYMTPGDGTYFRVIDISQEDYDALSEDEKANPNNLYLIPGDDVEYLTKTVADTLYAGINDIPDVSGLLSKTEAANTYQTIAGMSSYLTSSTAASTYLSKTDAANTYISKAEFPDEVRNPIDVYKDTVVTFDNGIDNGPMNKCAVYLYPRQTWNDGEPPSPENFCPINGRHNFTLNLADSESAQNPTTFLVEFRDKVSGFNGMVYGGYYDLITGDLTVTHIKKVFDGSETIRQDQEFTPTEKRNFKYYFDSLNYLYTTDVAVNNTYCSHYKPANPRSEVIVDLNDLECCFANEVQLPPSISATVFNWRHSEIATINAMKAYLAEQYANSTPLEIVGTLQEPIVYHIGPTHIRTLEGTNYLWISGDTGSEIEVEVISKNFDKVIAQILDDEATDYVPFETTSNIDIVNTDKNIHHVLNSYHDYAPAFFTYVNRTSSYRNAAALSTDYMEFNTMDSDDSTHFNERVRLDAKDGLLIQYHEDDNGSEGDLHKIELGYDGLKLDGMLVGNTVVVGCHETISGNDGDLTTDLSMFEMIALIEAGYDVTLRFLLEERTYPENVLTYRQVKMLRLEEYNHEFDNSGDPSAHDTIHLAFAHQHAYNKLWYYDMYSTDGQDTNRILRGQIA